MPISIYVSLNQKPVPVRPGHSYLAYGVWSGWQETIGGLQADGSHQGFQSCSGREIAVPGKDLCRKGPSL